MERTAKAFKGANTLQEIGIVAVKKAWVLHSTLPSLIFLFLFPLSWMFLPVSEVIHGCGEAQAKTREVGGGGQKALEWESGSSDHQLGG